jgi:hypothetical protein
VLLDEKAASQSGPALCENSTGDNVGAGVGVDVGVGVSVFVGMGVSVGEGVNVSGTVVAAGTEAKTHPMSSAVRNAKCNKYSPVRLFMFFLPC